MDKAIYWLAGVFIILALIQQAPKWGGLLLLIVVFSTLGLAAKRGLL